MSLKGLFSRLLGRKPKPQSTPPSLATLLHEIGVVLDNLARMPHADPTISRRLRHIRQELAELEAGCRTPAPPSDVVPTSTPTQLLQ